MLRDGCENRLRQIVTFEQMTEVQHRRLIGNGIAAKFQPRKRPHRLDIVKRFFRARIGQMGPLLQEVDPQRDGKRKCPSPALWAHLRIVRVNQRYQRRPPGTAAAIPAKNTSSFVTFFFAA